MLAAGFGPVIIYGTGSAVFALLETSRALARTSWGIRHVIGGLILMPLMNDNEHAGSCT